MWAAIFVVCNLVLPQVFHLIPQGGIIFAPLSLVILAGAYKFGWRVGLIAALVSPLVNHLLTGMPAWNVLPVMTFKLAMLALTAGFTAQHFKKVTLLLLIGVVLVDRRTWRIGTDGRHRSHRSGLCHRLARTATANHWCISRLQVLMNVVYAHGERVGK